MSTDFTAHAGTLTAANDSSATHVRAAARLSSIDMLRGLVIVLMALDHVRAYFSDVRFDPLDLTQTSPELFFTRWITHFCAPIFVFLAGISAWLVGQRGSKAELTRFLVTRGFWLIVLEFTVVNFAWNFNLTYRAGLFMQVIWAIGASMVALGALVHLRRRWIALIALAMIFGHNLLDGIEPSAFGVLAPLWHVIHAKGQTGPLFVLYPLVPWIGVMALGYCLGGVFQLEARMRRPMLLILGGTFIALFIGLRLLNVYGDPHPWEAQPSALYTVMSFLNVYKYPPSLLYVLMTLGPAFLLLALFDSVRGRFGSVLETFGRVPLFVYVLHIVLAHLFAGLLALAMGFDKTVLTSMFIEFPAGWGVGLGAVYGAWVLVLALLYLPARWFANVKKRRRDWWLSYL